VDIEMAEFDEGFGSESEEDEGIAEEFEENSDDEF
jgi:hypothetical protein